MSRELRSAAAPIAVALLSAMGIPARADPQASLGLTGAAEAEHAATARSGALDGAFHVGFRADLLQRAGPSTAGVGAYVDGAATTLGNFDLGGGAEALLPLAEDIPLVVGAGAFVRDTWAPGSWAPGLEGTLFLGSRSFNYHSWYGLTAGLFVQSRYVPGASGAVDGLVGLQMDTELLVLPWLLVWDALRR